MITCLYELVAAWSPEINIMYNKITIGLAALLLPITVMAEERIPELDLAFEQVLGVVEPITTVMSVIVFVYGLFNLAAYMNYSKGMNGIFASAFIYFFPSIIRNSLDKIAQPEEIEMTTNSGLGPFEFAMFVILFIGVAVYFYYYIKQRQLQEIREGMDDLLESHATDTTEQSREEVATILDIGESRNQSESSKVSTETEITASSHHTSHVKIEITPTVRSINLDD